MELVLYYLLGGLAGMANGLLAALLAQEKPVTLFRLRSLWLWLGLGLGGLFGMYGVWLFGALDRRYWVMFLLWGCLLSATVTDLSSRQISLLPVVVYSAVILAVRLFVNGTEVLFDALLGAGVGVLLLGLPKLVRPSSVGGGDVLLLAVCGLAAGVGGVFSVMLRSMIILIVVSLVLVLVKGTRRSVQVPLAPFLLAGVLI